MRLLAFILLQFYLVSHLCGQEPKMRLNVLDHGLEKYALFIEKSNDSTYFNKIHITNDFYNNIYDNNLIVIENNNSIIYIQRGNRMNYEEFIELLGVFTINEIPNEKGTFLISIGSDLNNPLYCDINEKEKNILIIDDRAKCIRRKWLDIQQSIESNNNEYYFIHKYMSGKEKEYLGLEITLKGILKNKISNKIISPEKLNKYISNSELKKPKKIKKILSVFEEN